LPNTRFTMHGGSVECSWWKNVRRPPIRPYVVIFYFSKFHIPLQTHCMPSHKNLS